jgi:hypothetical protein
VKTRRGVARRAKRLARRIGAPSTAKRLLGRQARAVARYNLLGRGHRRAFPFSVLAAHAQKRKLGRYPGLKKLLLKAGQRVA